MLTDSLDLELMVEPYFILLQSKSLSCPQGLSADRYLAHINYRILEKPASLTDHVRKVQLLQHEKPDQTKLAGALVDLFFILKTAGFALRRRLLLTSRELIDADVFKRLSDKLKNGSLSMSEAWLSGLPTLLVEKPVLEIVQRQAQASLGAADDDNNAMLLADEYIENSQIDLAIETLEAAVLKKPDDEEPANLLIELYRQTAEFDRFRGFWQKLGKRHTEALPTCWQLANLEFELS